MLPTILQVIQEFDAIGGAERVSWELALAFNRAGLKNGVIASMAGEKGNAETQVTIVSSWARRFSTRSSMRYLVRLAAYPSFTLAATRAVWQRAQSLVISHGDCLAGDIVVVHAVNAENLEIKKASGDWHWRLNPLHAWVALRDRWMIGGLRYRRYVAVSNRVSHELQKHYGVPDNRICIIPNGVDVERFKPDASFRRQVRQEFGIAQDARLLLFVGHEFDRKGLAFAVQAMERLGDSYRLLVVGSDNPAPYRAMAAVSGERIIFAGSQKSPEKFYAAADAFVFPTTYETFSLVCMEAMASGAIVFATPVGGIEDYLKDGRNGVIIRHDGADIAQKIDATFADPALFRQMQSEASKTAQGYSWDSIAAKYVDLLSEVLAERQAEAKLDPSSS